MHSHKDFKVTLCWHFPKHTKRHNLATYRRNHDLSVLAFNYRHLWLTKLRLCIFIGFVSCCCFSHPAVPSLPDSNPGLTSSENLIFPFLRFCTAKWAESRVCSLYSCLSCSDVFLPPRVSPLRQTLPALPFVSWARWELKLRVTRQPGWRRLF